MGVDWLSMMLLLLLLSLVSCATGLANLLAHDKKIPSSYLVKLKDDVDVNILDNLSRTYNAHYTFPSVKGFAAKLSKTELENLRSVDVVEFVEENSVVELDYKTQVNPPWNLDRVDQAQLPLDKKYKYSGSGAGVNVYVLDSGIWTTHNEFEGRAKHGYNFIHDQVDATDDHWHGTHVAAIIGGKTVGIAKEVSLIAVKIMPDSGVGSIDDQVAGMQFVIDSHKRTDKSVINFSVGNEGQSSFLELMACEVIQAGISMVMSSGNNNGDACKRTPARLGGSSRDFLVVNSIDANNTRAYSSNYGQCTDIFAPGVNVYSALSGSLSGNNAAFEYASGTSAAAPHVAGAAAIYMETEPAPVSPQQVKQALLDLSTVGIVRSLPRNTPDRVLFSPFE